MSNEQSAGVQVRMHAHHPDPVYPHSLETHEHDHEHEHDDHEHEDHLHPVSGQKQNQPQLSQLHDVEAQVDGRKRRLLPWLETSFSFLILSFLSILMLRSWIYPFFNRELITTLVFLYASIVVAFHAVLARICSNRSELVASMIVVDLFAIPMFVFAAQRACALW